MKKIQKQKGFTLVELAIVLTIIGLLIGGILKGQQLMQNSRVTATIAQIKGYEAAVTSFRDAYGALPGDLKKADVRIPDCPAAICNLTTNVGDGAVGDSSWDMITFQNSTAHLTTFPEGVETVLFWYELLKSGLISGVTDAAVNAGPPSFGKLLPAAKVGGGFWAGNSDGGSDTSLSGRPAGAGKYTLLGTILTMVDLPTQTLGVASNTQAMLPTTAAQIDRKIDDGAPQSGSIQPYGDVTSCYAKDVVANTDTSGWAYQEGVDKKDCGLHIRIQQ